jgi:phage terminase large subunit-like protein
MVFNSLVGLRQRVRQGWAQIESELKRRHDLIPQLVNVVAGLRVASPGIRVIKIVASQGKMLRAEPIGGLIQAGLVHFVGYHRKLEEELVSWIPNVKISPNRLDALVHGVTELMLSDRAAKARAGTNLESYY